MFELPQDLLLARARSVGPRVETQGDAIANLERVLATVCPVSFARRTSTTASAVEFCSLVFASKVHYADRPRSRNVRIATSVIPNVDS
jgi:hypothetical protein